MAKIKKGSLRASKSEPLKRYGTYKSKGALIRRAIHPEYYQHSWSNKVKRNRELFATAMEEYSKMDIVLKQKLTEGIYLVPRLPLPPISRDTISKWRRKIKDRLGLQPGLFPPYFPWPYNAPFPQPLPNPNIDQAPWPWKDWSPWPNERGVGGKDQHLRDKYGQDGQRNPQRSPFPPDVPTPGDTDDERHPTKIPPTIIVVEVDPEGALWQGYRLAVWAKGEYGEVRRVIEAHKREVVILVVVGALIVFGYMLIAGGVEIAGGTELLANPEATPLYSGLGLLGPLQAAKHIEHYYYKKLTLGLAKQLDIHGYNYTRQWPCYKEVAQLNTTIIYSIYSGPSAGNKGELGAVVEVTFNLKEKTAQISAACGTSEDEIAVYNGNREILHCNPSPEGSDVLYLYNFSQGCYGEAQVFIMGDTFVYAFEDRPVWGDGDYNDAYGYVKKDKKGNVIAAWAREGEHADTIAVYFRNIQIGYYPGWW